MANKGLTILLADDDSEDLELIEEAFLYVKPGLKFYKVNNGKAVIPFLDKQQDNELPGLIILDYNMPELNASMVLSRMINNPRYKFIQKVILSTSDHSAHIKECMANGASAYFVKPGSMQELRSIANKILAAYES